MAGFRIMKASNSNRLKGFDRISSNTFSMISLKSESTRLPRTSSPVMRISLVLLKSNCYVSCISRRLTAASKPDMIGMLLSSITSRYCSCWCNNFLGFKAKRSDFWAASCPQGGSLAFFSIRRIASLPLNAWSTFSTPNCWKRPSKAMMLNGSSSTTKILLQWHL